MCFGANGKGTLEVSLQGGNTQLPVTPPKLALANLMESLAIHSAEPTCDQIGNHPYKNIRVNAREGE
jgi:hypothetical protein